MIAPERLLSKYLHVPLDTAAISGILALKSAGQFGGGLYAEPQRCGIRSFSFCFDGLEPPVLFVFGGPILNRRSGWVTSPAIGLSENSFAQLRGEQ